MGKVQILAVLTMDGCLSSELYDKAHQDLCLDRCGLDEIRKKAFYRVTPDYSISMGSSRNHGAFVKIEDFKMLKFRRIV